MEIFENIGYQSSRVNEKLYNLKKDDIEFSFIQIKQIGAPAILENILSLGVSKCKNILFVGSVGALKEDMNVGDLVIPKCCICGDGASRYLNDDLSDDFGKIIEPNKDLTRLLIEETEKYLDKKDVKYHFATNYSIDTIFAQFPHLDKIKQMGSEVIEMELYTLFKAAKIAGIKTAALCRVSDNTMVNKSLYSGRTIVDKEKSANTKNIIIPSIIISTIKRLK